MKLSYKYISTFVHLLLILTACGKSCPSNIPTCELEPDSGPCEAAITKYYFDKEEKKCTTFLYGGCYGVIPFNSIEECLQCECNY